MRVTLRGSSWLAACLPLLLCGLLDAQPRSPVMVAPAAEGGGPVGGEAAEPAKASEPAPLSRAAVPSSGVNDQGEANAKASASQNKTETLHFSVNWPSGL